MSTYKYFVCTLSFFVVVLVTSAQEQVKNYVKQQAVQITTIEPGSTDYTDLEVIGAAIGEARIVMLGEQDHGDAPTYLAKARLIKYLHEKKGFDVLAFESDFFSLNEGWDQLKKDHGQINSFLRSNIYPIWSYCDACSTLLYQYIPSTYSSTLPLEITGFDSDLVLQYASNNLILRLDSVIHHLQLPIANNQNYRNQILPLLDSLKFGFSSTLDASFYTRSLSYLQSINSQMAAKLSKQDFWLQVIDNLISANINHEARNTDVIRSVNARDSQMAQNLSWLTNAKFPGKKIIVWAANQHIGKSTDTLVKNKSGQGFTSMGAFFTKDTSLLNNTYILGFTSYSGRAGRLTMNEYTIPKPGLNSFESWIDTTYQFAFVDFRMFNKTAATAKESFYLKGFMHFPEKEDWTKVFDGVFYIRDMYPCKQ